MDKRQALAIIFKCAQEYRKNLEGTNILIAFGNKDSMRHFEVQFHARNFLHLTGIELRPGRFASSSVFYNNCLDKRLAVTDFSFSKNGTTEMKLFVLPQMMEIYKFAKMVGDYNFSKSLLVTEKLAGNVTACMGFIRDDEYYVPNTVLKEDIRDITKVPQQRILAVFKKGIDEELYSEICYLAKGISVETLILPENLTSKIKMNMLVHKNDNISHKEVVATQEPYAPARHSIHDRLNAATVEVARREAERTEPKQDYQMEADTPKR